MAMGSTGRIADDFLAGLRDLLPRSAWGGGYDELAARVASAKFDPSLEERLAQMAVDWLVRTCTPAWIEAAGMEEEARKLRALPRITASRTVDAASAAGRELVRVLEEAVERLDLPPEMTVRHDEAAKRTVVTADWVGRMLLSGPPYGELLDRQNSLVNLAVWLVLDRAPSRVGPTVARLCESQIGLLRELIAPRD